MTKFQILKLRLQWAGKKFDDAVQRLIDHWFARRGDIYRVTYTYQKSINSKPTPITFYVREFTPPAIGSSSPHGVLTRWDMAMFDPSPPPREKRPRAEKVIGPQRLTIV